MGWTMKPVCQNCAAASNAFSARGEIEGHPLYGIAQQRAHIPDYQCDHTAWGVELVKRVGSERFKLLYDIFHMQIMEGDVCDTIRENHQYFDHCPYFGGVPGRAEIDGTQELNYSRIMEAILATGFRGYVAQEFVPARPDALASLRQGICKFVTSDITV